jgi:hypothetical protein
MVHHKDGNPLNNEIKNLQIINKHIHGSSHSIMNEIPTRNITLCDFPSNLSRALRIESIRRETTITKLAMKIFKEWFQQNNIEY